MISAESLEKLFPAFGPFEAQARRMPLPVLLEFLECARAGILQTGVTKAMLAAERKAQSEKLEAAIASGDIDAEAAAKARRIMGFA